MAKFKYSLLITLFAALLISCGMDVKNELKDYIENTLPGIMELEDEVHNSFNSVTGANYQGDEKMVDAFRNEVIPACDKLLQQAEAVTLKSKDIAEAHQLFVDSYKLKRQTCENAILYVEGKGNDDEPIARAFADADSMLDEYVERIQELIAKYKLNE